MDFADALKILHKGDPVKNVNWNGKGMYLVLMKPGSDEGVPVIYLCMPDDHPHYPHKVIPWTPSQLDLMSDGWEVVNGEVA